MIATCPSREELEAFSLGRLPDDTIESIAEHLESCPACEDTVAVFDDRSDTFLGNLHGPTPEDPFADESACREAVSAARDLAFDASLADQPPEEAEDVLLGRIGDYQLLAKLGHGGMGTVFRALHTRMRRVVALKVLTTHRRHDPAVVERFGREIEAAGKLSHPNIVTAHDAGEEDGMHYLVMELVEGVDLHTLITQHGPLPVADACEIIRQAALGLQHAHEHGLVHRDLKPSNIMLTQMRNAECRMQNDNESDSSAFRIPHSAFVKILDLGLARLQGDQVASEDLTATGQVMGTLDYMAPEQADDSHGVDIRSDIYALGCTLFKLLTGRAPFSGESYNTLAKKLRGHAEDPPPPIRESRPEVPEGLADLVDGMLAKAPDDRPATPAAVAVALEPFCDACDLPTLVSQIDIPAQHDLNAASRAEIAMMLPTPKPSVRSGRRSPLHVFAVVASLMLLATAVAAVVIAIRRGDGPATTVEVPAGSNVTIGEDGGVAVTLPVEPSPVAGQAVNGITVAFAVSSTQWKPGDEIELICSYKNDTEEPIHVPRWGVALPAMEVTRFVDSRVAMDAAVSRAVRKSIQQFPQELGAAHRQLQKETFVKVLPGQTVSVTRRGILEKDGQLAIEWPNGAVQMWSLENGRFRLTAILEFHDDEQVLARFAREIGLENAWYGKAVSGTVDVTVSGVVRLPVDVPADEPTYGGKPLSYWATQLTDRDAEYRAKAVDALVSFGAAGVDPLVTMLRSGDGDSKVQALTGIERLAPKAQHALPAVIQATADADEQVRERAAFCLAEYGPQAASAVPGLVKLTKDTNHDVREVAVWALWRVRSQPEETVPALIAATQDEDVRVMRAAAFALGDFPEQSEQIVPALAAFFETPGRRSFMHIDPGDRVVAAEFLSDEQRKELLVEDTGSDWRAISAGAAASYALGRLGPPGAAKLIELSQREYGGGMIHGLTYSSEPAAVRRLSQLLNAEPQIIWPVMNAVGKAAENNLTVFLSGMKGLQPAERAEVGWALAHYARNDGPSSPMGFGASDWRTLFKRDAAIRSTFDRLRPHSTIKPSELIVVAAALLDPDRAKRVLPELLQQKDAAKLRPTTELVLRYLDGKLPKQEAAGDQRENDDSSSANGPVDRRPAAEVLQEESAVLIHRVTLQTAVSRLSAQHNVSIVLERDVPADTEVSVATHGVTLDTALRQMVGPLNLAFKTEGDRITISRLPTAPVAFYKPAGLVVVRRTSEKGPFHRQAVGTYPDFLELPLGQVTRLKILDSPRRPGVRLYPTIEVERARGLPSGAPKTDRLPIPIELTEEDFDQVASGHMVTKAVSTDRETGKLATYVEVQLPQALTQFGPYDQDESPIASPFADGQEEPAPLASPLAGAFAGVEPIREFRVDPGVDAIVVANRAGSLLAIVRIGNIDLEYKDADGQLQVRAPDYRRVMVHRTNSGGETKNLGVCFYDRPVSLPFGSTVDLDLYSKPLGGVQTPSLLVKLEIPPANAHTATFLAHCSIPLQFTDCEYNQIADGKEVTKVFFLPAPAFTELALAGVETLMDTRLDPGIDPVAEATRRGAVLAIAKVTLVKQKDASQSTDAELLGEVLITPEPEKAAFYSLQEKVEEAVMRAREKKDADPKRTLAELRTLRDEVRRSPYRSHDECEQLIDEINRLIDSQFGFPAASRDRQVSLANTDSAKVPVRLLWTPKGPVLVAQDTSQPAAAVEVYRQEERRWALASTLEQVSPPVFAFGVGDDVGIITVTQKHANADTRDGTVVLPENTVQCVRFAPEKATAATVISLPENGSTGIIAAASRGEIVSVFLMRSPGGEILYLRSTDGGKSWPFKPVRVAEAMATDRVFAQSGFHLSADHLGLFAYDNQETPVLLRTVDGGKAWSQEALSPSGLHGPACFPLACFPVDGELGLVYVARLGRGEEKGKGQFFFTTSQDQARTWPPSEPLGKAFDWDDGAESARVIGDSRGRTIALSHPTLILREAGSKLDYLVSTNLGVTWQLADDSVWFSAGSAAAISPGEDRVVFAANVHHGDRGSFPQELLVKEFDLVEGKPKSQAPFGDTEPNASDAQQHEKQDESSGNATTNPNG